MNRRLSSYTLKKQPSTNTQNHPLMHGQEALPDRASEQGFGTHQLVQLSTASKPTLLSDYAESNFRARCYRTPNNRCIDLVCRVCKLRSWRENTTFMQSKQIKAFAPFLKKPVLIGEF